MGGLEFFRELVYYANYSFVFLGWDRVIVPIGGFSSSTGTHQDPTGAGRGGDENEAATRFKPSTQPNMSALSLKK